MLFISLSLAFTFLAFASYLFSIRRPLQTKFKIPEYYVLICTTIWINIIVINFCKPLKKSDIVRTSWNLTSGPVRPLGKLGSRLGQPIFRGRQFCQTKIFVEIHKWNNVGLF